MPPAISTNAHDPKCRDEYDNAYKAHTVFEGFGLDTTMVVPCPFCAAPKFMRWSPVPTSPIAIEKVLEAGAICEKCGRGMRGITDTSGGDVRVEMVQTCGVDPAPYLPPMRRVA